MGLFEAMVIRNNLVVENEANLKYRSLSKVYGAGINCFYDLLIRKKKSQKRYNVILKRIKDNRSDI